VLNATLAETTAFGGFLPEMVTFPNLTFVPRPALLRTVTTSAVSEDCIFILAPVIRNV
jgi:hypothetical protein